MHKQSLDVQSKYHLTPEEPFRELAERRNSVMKVLHCMIAMAATNRIPEMPFFRRGLPLTPDA
jgi:hypothetical protein